MNTQAIQMALVELKKAVAMMEQALQLVAEGEETVQSTGFMPGTGRM